MQIFSSWTGTSKFRIFLKILRLGKVRTVIIWKSFLYFFSSCCIYFTRRLSKAIHHFLFFWCWVLSQVQILDTVYKTKSERQYIFWVSDHRRTSIRFLLFNKAALFSFELSRCVFSVQSFAEHHTAFTSRYSSNGTFQVMQPSLMWLPVMIPDFDASLFPHLAVAPWSNTVSFGGSCAALCPSLATVLFHWAQPVDVLIAKGVSFDFEKPPPPWTPRGVFSSI